MIVRIILWSEMWKITWSSHLKHEKKYAPVIWLMWDTIIILLLRSWMRKKKLSMNNFAMILLFWSLLTFSSHDLHPAFFWAPLVLEHFFCNLVIFISENFMIFIFLDHIVWSYNCVLIKISKNSFEINTWILPFNAKRIFLANSKSYRSKFKYFSQSSNHFLKKVVNFHQNFKYYGLNINYFCQNIKDFGQNIAHFRQSLQHFSQDLEHFAQNI